VASLKVVPEHLRALVKESDRRGEKLPHRCASTQYVILLGGINVSIPLEGALKLRAIRYN
jgi:hypothetical protein